MISKTELTKRLNITEKWIQRILKVSLRLIQQSNRRVKSDVMTNKAKKKKLVPTNHLK